MQTLCPYLAIKVVASKLHDIIEGSRDSAPNTNGVLKFTGRASARPGFFWTTLWQ